MAGGRPHPHRMNPQQSGYKILQSGKTRETIAV
jgi:hypothetical protein